MTRWLLAVAACSGSAPPAKPTPPAGPPLYDRLGGMDAITDVVARAVADPKLALDKGEFTQQFARAICELAGGPCKSERIAMRPGDYAVLIADLTAAFDERRVGAADKAELRRVLESLKSQIVSP